MVSYTFEVDHVKQLSKSLPWLVTFQERLLSSLLTKPESQPIQSLISTTGNSIWLVDEKVLPSFFAFAMATATGGHCKQESHP